MPACTRGSGTGGRRTSQRRQANAPAHDDDDEQLSELFGDAFRFHSSGPVGRLPLRAAAGGTSLPRAVVRCTAAKRWIALAVPSARKPASSEDASESGPQRRRHQCTGAAVRSCMLWDGLLLACCKFGFELARARVCIGTAKPTAVAAGARGTAH